MTQSYLISWCATGEKDPIMLMLIRAVGRQLAGLEGAWERWQETRSNIGTEKPTLTSWGKMICQILIKKKLTSRCLGLQLLNLNLWHSFQSEIEAHHFLFFDFHLIIPLIFWRGRSIQINLFYILSHKKTDPVSVTEIRSSWGVVRKWGNITWRDKWTQNANKLLIMDLSSFK